VGLVQPHGGTPIEDAEPAVEGLQLIVLEIGVIFGYIVQIDRELMICKGIKRVFKRTPISWMGVCVVLRLHVSTTREILIEKPEKSNAHGASDH